MNHNIENNNHQGIEVILEDELNLSIHKKRNIPYQLIEGMMVD
jgi:hypothetical protein